jgi:hypothetical protein
MKDYILISNSCGLLLLSHLLLPETAISATLNLDPQNNGSNSLLTTPETVAQSRQNRIIRRRSTTPIRTNRTPVKRNSPPIAPPPIINPSPITPISAPPPPVQGDGDEWALSALQTLGDRYGCSVPTITGARRLTRAEFAASLVSCIDKMEGSIANRSIAPTPTVNEDMALLERLQQEFASELATLISRIDQKADKSRQFSTTTKLQGEVVFGIADTFGNRSNTTGDLNVPVFGYRGRLNFNTSFSGQDLLRIRLQARDVPQFNATTGTNMTRLSFDGAAANNNPLSVDDFFYRFSLGKDTNAWIIANGYGSENLAPTLSPIASDGNAAISRSSRFSPIYRIVEGPGVAVQHKFNDQFNLSLAYRARNATNQTLGNGLFNGNSGLLSQLTFKPSKELDLGIHYANVYFPAGGANVAGSTGSTFANQPFANDTATQTNTYGLVASYNISPSLILSGWAGFTDARGTSGTDINKNASLNNWMLTLSFPDLGQKGNLAAVSIGMPAKITSNDNAARRDGDSSLHLEAFYRHQLTDSVAITPGFFIVTNPDHNSNNPTQVVGVVRTTLSF